MTEAAGYKTPEHSQGLKWYPQFYAKVLPSVSEQNDFSFLCISTVKAQENISWTLITAF